ncbi:hypothetical protein CPK_ORF00560 [Chlamydia pneumoniae LPCoLN]|nr:hypothetical protein CPK_ORF00560 [Chlamydia pneumoniae LPCoLN]
MSGKIILENILKLFTLGLNLLQNKAFFQGHCCIRNKVE